MIVCSSARTRLRFELLEDRAVPATLFVDDDRRPRSKVEFTTIQAAVDAAAPGDTIIVAQGTYTEQVTFTAEKDDITLRAQNPQKVFIVPPAALTGEQAIVTVDGADGVTVRGFTITGPAAAPNTLDFGVAVLNGGSATIADNTITAIRNNPLDGIQLGVAVYVAADGQATSAVIRDNRLTDYQKGGVVVDGEGASAVVAGNTITGSGPTALIAQNGVQVSDGATAVISGNDISRNLYTGAGTVGTGILIDGTDGVLVSGNRVFDNQVGLLAFDSSDLFLIGNRLTDNTLDGADLIGVTGGVVADNRVENNASDGLVLSGSTGITVFGNTVRRNGGDGLVLTDGSADNTVFGNTLRQNDGFDAFDDTTGDLTGGTANRWFRNRIDTSNVPGLE